MKARTRGSWVLPLLVLIGIGVGGPVAADCEDRKSILYLAFSRGTLSMVEVSDYADRIVGNYLRNLPGVADVVTFGDRHPVPILSIRVDPSRLAAHGRALADIEAALRRQGIEAPADPTSNDTIQVPASSIEPRRLDEVAELTIGQEGDSAVRPLDLAEIVVAIKDAHSGATYGGKDVVALGVVNQPSAGVLAIWFVVSRALATIRPMTPHDMRVELANPFSIVILSAE
jgi:HAE1 family hydrophobic/amphiphilic exporter-1